MGEGKELGFEDVSSTVEDRETLAAIEEGIQDAKVGRGFTARGVRERLQQWVSGRRDKVKPDKRRATSP
jgi:predicted transcriptional regulator